MKKGIHIMNPKQSIRHRTTFILYSIWVHGESPRYKRICL